jgi:ABC-type glycerol-3-phosphate transport system substrate-binding protein
MKKVWLSARINLLMIAAVFVLIAALVSGCSGKTSSDGAGEGSNHQAEKADPVTLKVYVEQQVPDALWETFVTKLKHKYPHITLEVIKPTPGQFIENLISAGTVPDLVMSWNGATGKFEALDLLEDLTPLLKKHNLPVDRFEPVTIQAIKDSGIGELVALPYFLNTNALYYNKDLFDKFGVEYPMDGMTWEDVIEVAKKVTRNVDGVQYAGLSHESVTRIASPKSLVIVNPATNKAEVNNDQWKKVFELSHSIFSIPGNGEAIRSGCSLLERGKCSGAV